MTSSVARIRLVLLLVLSATTVFIWWDTLFVSSAAQYEGKLQVSFLDVGQGDAMYIATPDGVQVLIDGGPDSSVLAKLAAVMPAFDTSLDVIIGTHPDLDHVAGLVDVLARYDVDRIITTEATGDSPAALAWATAVQAESAQILNVRAGEVFMLGASTTLTILSPTYDPTLLNSNTGSIVALLQYGEIGFMLTGDAPQGIESYLVSTHGTNLEAEVLKLGHHGSDTSSGSDFLAAVNPLFAVVSASADNRYGHPAPEVLERVAATNAQVVSTQTGDVHFYTDGTKIWQE